MPWAKKEWRANSQDAGAFFRCSGRELYNQGKKYRKKKFVNEIINQTDIPIYPTKGAVQCKMWSKSQANIEWF